MGTRELWLNVVMPWQERRRLNGNRSLSAATAEPAPAKAAVPQPVKRLKSQG